VFGIIRMINDLEKYDNMDKVEFSDMMKGRTKDLAIQVIRFVDDFPTKTSYNTVGRQIIRSATSTAANYRAAIRARSKREFFSKLSIVIEECDETLFWLELLNESKMVDKSKTSALLKESEEILKILSKARKTMSNNK
jgi:four helix bundle protein